MSATAKATVQTPLGLRGLPRSRQGEAGTFEVFFPHVFVNPRGRSAANGTLSAG
jgi:hypothetical protein